MGSCTMEKIKADDKKKLEVLDDELEQVSGGSTTEDLIKKLNGIFGIKNDILNDYSKKD